jgi:hypothetical protein
MHQHRIRYLGNHFNPASQEWRKILPSPKRSPSQNGARRKKHRPAPLGGTSNETVELEFNGLSHD